MFARSFEGMVLVASWRKAVIQEARQIGYHSMRLDTLPSMEQAIVMYRMLGFKEIEPYTFNPVPGALFLELTLS